MEPTPQKSLVLPLVLTVLASAAVFGSLGYYLANSKNVKEATVTPTAVSTTTLPTPKSTVTPDETASWKTYANQEIGFSFKYPAEWGNYKLFTTKPSTTPVESKGYSHSVSFPDNLTKSVTVGFNTLDFSAPRHPNYWEVLSKKTAQSCTELQTNYPDMIIKNSCEEISTESGMKSFLALLDWFNEKPLVGIIYSGISTYPVFTVSANNGSATPESKALIKKVLNTFRFTK